MADEIIKQGETSSAIQALRQVITIDSGEGVAIVKTAVKDGMRGLVARGMTVLQRWNEMRFGEAFLSELEEMKRAGEICDDFDRTDAGVNSVREFFEMIDGKPDEERFRSFCALFMSANRPDATSSEAILDLELMGILRRLSAGEMHLLSAFLKIRFYAIGSGNIFDLLSKNARHNSAALVGRNVKTLLDENLVNRKTWEQHFGSPGERKALLTDLGEALLHRIERYNKFKENGQGNSSDAKGCATDPR